MLFVLAVFALLASAISVNKIILFALSPTLLVGLRMFFGGLVLLGFNYLRKKNLNFHQIKTHLFLLVFIAVFTTFIPSFLKAYSLKHLVSSEAAFLGALDPFFTSFVAYFLFNEKLTKYKILGILIGFTGVMISIYTDPSCKIANFACISLPKIAMVVAVITSRFGWMIAQKSLKSEFFSPTQMNTITMLMSGIISLFTAYLFSEMVWGSLANAPFSILQNFPFNYLAPKLHLFVFVLYSTLVGNAIAYNLYAYILKKYSSVLISLSSFTVPIFVHFYGWLFLSEQLSLGFLISCLITFLGLFVFTIKEK